MLKIKCVVIKWDISINICYDDIHFEIIIIKKLKYINSKLY